MLEDADVQRYFKFATSLNHAPGWHVPEPVLLEYAQAIAQLGHLTDTLAFQTLQHYHADHQQIQALQNSGDAKHAASWIELRELVVRTLSIKLSKLSSYVDKVDVLEEITQEAMHAISMGVTKFRYASSLRTWVYTVVIHSTAQHFRSQGTTKRGAKVQTHSLEELAMCGEVVYDPAPSLETQALDHTLVEIVTQALSDVPDERVRLVFHMWVFEQQTLREIGQKLSLSPSRVHGLYKQATSLLKAHPAVLDWLSIEVGSRLDI